MIESFFLIVTLVALMVVFLLPRGELPGARPIYDLPRCGDCGIRTRGGPRCYECADRHVETMRRWEEFRHVWPRIAIAAYRQSRGIATHPTGVYR